MAAYKVRGGVLGSARPECRDNLGQPARIEGAADAGVAAKELADDAYADLVPEIRAWRAEGLSQREIAGRLDPQGNAIRRGRPWDQVQVMRILGAGLLRGRQRVRRVPGVGVPSRQLISDGPGDGNQAGCRAAFDADPELARGRVVRTRARSGRWRAPGARPASSSREADSWATRGRASPADDEKAGLARG